MSGSRNVVLAGPMGSGKTSVGRLLAKRLGRRFVDTDSLVTTATGKTVAELFAEEGEAAFRALEAEAITAVCERDGLVVAVGGGAVVDPANAARLRERSHVVVLGATADALAERVRRGLHSGQRPLLDGTDDDLTARLERLGREREQAYAEAAHARFDTTGRSLEQVVTAIAEWLEEQQ